jgi:TPR repeat protein
MRIGHVDYSLRAILKLAGWGLLALWILFGLALQLSPTLQRLVEERERHGWVWKPVRQERGANDDPLARILAKSEMGDAVAQLSLGNSYYRGQGVAKNYVEAVKWFRKAAEQNLVGGQFFLGICYYTGQGVAKDYAEAVKWFRKAADQNVAEAQCNLGTCYFQGEGVAKDYAEAVKWFRKAADQNVAEAQCNLGSCYLDGQGVEKDETQAIKWFRKAAEGGLVDVSAFNKLAWLLATSGNSEIRDGSNAVFFAEKAAAATNRKDPAVLDTLAVAYAEAGQFEKAISTQREAIALLRTDAEKADYLNHLKLFELHQPYRAEDNH